MQALISVHDKAGIENLARAAEQAGYDVISTGGTGDVLKAAGLKVMQVSDVTGFPEILNGRVKTLHPVIHGGILARMDVEDHQDQLDQYGIDRIGLVVANLYPFSETVSRAGTELDWALENIDIGGPAMVRAAAKNFPHVVVVVDPVDYMWISERLISGEGIMFGERKRLAQKAFQHVSLYDSAIAKYLSDNRQPFSDELTLGYLKVKDLRYGENPHQRGTLYADLLSTGGVSRAELLHGPEMSFTNILDADAAWTIANDFAEQAVVIVKHTNPCGLALHEDQATAYNRALRGDQISAYGGIVGFNRTVTAATAESMKGILFDVVVAPGYDSKALEIFRKRRRTRLLQADLGMGERIKLDIRSVSGGALLQTPDDITEDPTDWKIVTKRGPTETEMKDLTFAWQASRHIKSNTVVLARYNSIIGMGAGQPNRVTSIHLALRIAGKEANGSVLASDAFMPFADNIHLAAEGGITAVVQPGGSIRDEEVVDAANEARMAMVFTGTRHFRH